jgi:hypothetical protein
MLSMEADALTSSVEQIGHQLEEDGFHIRPLHIVPPNSDLDPEDDPYSISSIYNNLISTLPAHNLGLKAADITTKVQTIREIAIDVGLANIGILRPYTETESLSFNNLRRFHNIDPSVQLSAPAKYVLDKWGELPQVDEPREVVSKRKRRVKLDESQKAVADITMSQMNVRFNELAMSSSQRSTDGSVPFTMSQPERGVHGTRNLRKKTRRSGF